MKVFLLLTFSSVALSACPHDAGDLKSWDDPATWPSQYVPGLGAVVTIDQPILLSSETEELGGISIVDGGRLVFDPTSPLSKVTTNFIHIQDGGEMLIGSSDCKYTPGVAEVLLTGMRDDSLDIENFGQKFIGVDVGGTLDIHGETKLPWTRLLEPLSKKAKIFSTDIAGQPENLSGMVLYEFAPDGSLIQMIEHIDQLEEMTQALTSLQGDSVVIMSLSGQTSDSIWDNRSDYEVQIENLLLNDQHQISLDQLQAYGDPWTLIVNRADLSTLQEEFAFVEGADDTDGATTPEIRVQFGDVIYRTSTSSRVHSKGVDKVNVDTLPTDYFDNQIRVEDNVESWKVGDQFVIASTDFDYKQAEVFEIATVAGDTIMFNGEVLFDHYAGASYGVDMSAEVGLLTRNVKIHGKMEDSCYTELNKCHIYDFDTFGGQTMAIKGFKKYEIEGAELYHMGQTTVLGAYPIHVHMAEDTTENGSTPPIWQSNSIHNTLSRCFTIHGSHHVTVKDNVAFDHIGHCVFLEDGGEKYTNIEGNLVLSTLEGTQTSGDDEATSFWITSPLTTMKNNVAAGGQNTGIWYIFPDKPVGPSIGMFFKRLEAKNTPLTLFENNVAHSYKEIGLAFFRRLGRDHSVIDCSTYSPLTMPRIKSSEYQPIIMDGFIGYNNRMKNVVMRSAATYLRNFYVANSLIGIELNRNMMGGFQKIENSVIVGTTDNVGSGQEIEIKNENGKWVKVWHNASLPYPLEPYQDQVGVSIRAEGPSHFENVEFKNFQHNYLRKGAAIKWRDEYIFHNGITTSAKNVSFNYDVSEGHTIWEKDEQLGRNDPTISIKDDGSISGTAGTLFKKNQYYSINDNCIEVPNTNMERCLRKYSRVFVRAKISKEKKSSGVQNFITDANNQIIYEQNKKAMTIAYTIGENEHYTLHWSNKSSMPDEFRARVSGLEAGDVTRIGFCLPLQTVSMEDEELFTGEPAPVAASSLSELDSDSSKNYFFDRTMGIVYAKFSETNARGPEDYADCVGGLRMEYCPHFRIKFDTARNADLFDGDCTNRGTIA